MQCSKNYFKSFFPQEAGAFGNNIEKETKKPHQKLKKHVCYILTDICSAYNPMQVIAFYKNVLIL